MKLGKPSARVLAETIFTQTGAMSSLVLKGPKPGVDVSVLKTGPRQVMILSTDPLSLIPRLGASRSAWLSVHAIASDVATSGVAPRYAMFDLNLPPSMSDSLLENYWEGVHESCRDLRISILGGHTGRFDGCDYTVIGGGTLFGLAERGGYVTSDMAKPGDIIIMTKSAATEATAVLSHCYPRTIERSLGKRQLQRAKELFRSVSVVKDAMAAAAVGLETRAVSAMHDVTEGGVLSAAVEMAEASRLKARVQANGIPVFDEVRSVCQLFGIDPLRSLGQGSLLIASKRGNSAKIISELRRRGISSRVIGTLAKGTSHTITDASGTQELAYPREDPYWKAFWDASRRGWT